MDKYYIALDRADSFFDAKYELRKGSPTNNYRGDFVEAFMTLYFAKRRARKLRSVEGKRHVVVWIEE